MDVEGRRPTSELGADFHANIWAWGVILEAMTHCQCDDLMGTEMRRTICFNDGEGPVGQEVCSLMADRLTVIPQREYEALGNDGEKEYGAVARFVVFLRECGGFRVW